MSTQSTELSLLPELPTKETALLIFKSPQGLEPFLQHVREQVAKYPVVDIGTAKGRKELASMAFAVTKSKTALDNLGKAVVDDLKEIPKLVDASRKTMRDELDALAAKVRQPLTDWETAEAKRKAEEAERKAKMEAAIAKIREQGNVQWGMSADSLRERISRVESVPVTEEEWGDLADSAKQACAQALANLRGMLSEREAFEEQQRELELQRTQIEQQAVTTAAPAPASTQAQPQSSGNLAQGMDLAAANVQVHDEPTNEPVRSGFVRGTPPTAQEAAAADAIARISGVTALQARTIVKAIAKGSIPHIAIQ